MNREGFSMKRYTMEIQFDTSNDIGSAIVIAKEDPNGEFTGATDALRLKDTLEMAYRCIVSTAHYDHMKYAQDVRNQIKNLWMNLKEKIQVTDQYKRALRACTDGMLRMTKDGDYQILLLQLSK